MIAAAMRSRRAGGGSIGSIVLGEAVDREPQLGYLRLALRARRQMRSHRGGFFGVDRPQGERPEQVARCGVSGHGQVRFHD